MQFAFIGIVIVVGIVIALASYFTSAAYRIRKQLREAVRRPIGELGPGMAAKVIGRVVPVETGLLQAPLSGRPCVFYEAVVEEHVSSGRSSHWVERIRESNRVDFALDDSTGVVRVSSREQMDYLAERDSEQRSGTFNDAAPHLEAFLARHGMKSQGWVFNKSLRYREGVFEPGEAVAVVGVVEHEDDPDGSAEAQGYRATARRAVLKAPAGGALVASDEKGITLA
ncbi:MAG: GIDE domain-containing protein [Polyangiaceae bacterium]